MPISHPVASTEALIVWFVVATCAAVNPVDPAAVHPTAPADCVKSVVAAVPPTANALAPNADAPNRRVRAFLFFFMPVSLSQQSDNRPRFSEPARRSVALSSLAPRSEG